MQDILARSLPFKPTLVAVCFGILALGAHAAENPARCTGPICDDLVYVGAHGAGEGQGITAARFDPRSGRLVSLGLAAQVDQPTWLVVNPKTPALYAVSEIGNDGKTEASVHGFQIETKTGVLKPLGAVSSGGGGATHLALTRSANALFVANYGSGKIGALAVLADGSLAPPNSVQTTYGAGPSPRQKSPHPHGVTVDPSGRFVLAPDLGADRIFIYRIDPQSKALAPADEPFAATPPGSGPRHLLFTPNGRLAFLNTELDAQIRAYSWDAAKGRLRFLGSRPTADPSYTGSRSAAGIAISNDSRFLYVSNRGEDVLIVYAIDAASGALTEIQRVSSGGNNPTSLTLHRSGRWMLVANEASDAVAVFSVETRSGRLTDTRQSLSTPHPVQAAFYPG